MTGGIGDEKLSGRSGISFDIINESENFPILEIFFVDRFGLYRMRIGQMMTVFEIMIQGGIVVDLFIGEMEFGVVLRIRKIHPPWFCLLIGIIRFFQFLFQILEFIGDFLNTNRIIWIFNRVECREKRPTVFQESRS